MTTALVEVAPSPKRPYELGVVVDYNQVNPTTIGLSETRPAAVVRPKIIDPYIEKLSPERIQEIQSREHIMDATARRLREQGEWTANPKTAPYLRREQWGSPTAQAMFMGPGKELADEPIHAWQQAIPHPVALLPLADPVNCPVFSERNGQFVTIEATQNMRDWMIACTDAREIRNRGAVMAAEFVEALQARSMKQPGRELLMVSVAAGTLLPTLQAAMKSGLDHKVRIIMLEKDENAIAVTQYLAGQLGFKGKLDIRRIDVFRPNSMEEQLREFEGKAVTVDAVGIFEYINEQLKQDGKTSNYMLFNPEKFFQMIYRFAAEDGVLVLGQMRSDRPHGDFTRGVVGWPYVVQRPPKELMNIMTRAGAKPNQIKLSLTPMGVYTMASVYKRPYNQRQTVQDGLIHLIGQSL